MVVRPLKDAGRGAFRGLAKGRGRAVILLRRMTLGSGYRYLMESVAVGDGAPGQSSNLTRYYAESGTPPGVFMGAGLAGLDEGRGVGHGSAVTEEHLFNLLGMCADPITGKPLGRQPNRAHLSLSKRVAQRMAAITATHTVAERAEESARIEAEERVKEGAFRPPVAGFDLTFSPSKSVSTAWALADRETKEQIYACHRRALEVVLSYAEREVLRSTLRHPSPTPDLASPLHDLAPCRLRSVSCSGVPSTLLAGAEQTLHLDFNLEPVISRENLRDRHGTMDCLIMMVCEGLGHFPGREFLDSGGAPLG
jgi:hypothetical protein